MESTTPFKKSFNQRVVLPELAEMNLFIKREDLIHPEISGNKYRKLKYNINFAKENGYMGLLSFGGAHSNHIAALAAFGKEASLKTVGIIRGEELSKKSDDIPTLKTALEKGMKLVFISREDYKKRHNAAFINHIKETFGSKFFYVPEGGSNHLGVKGCQEILDSQDAVFDTVCCPVGTGGTLLGIAKSVRDNQKILGFSALKTIDISKEIDLQIERLSLTDVHIFEDSVFGGYARVNDQLINFINYFYKKTAIPLDPIYTGKMLFRIVDLYKNNYLRAENKVLMIHTGGLQGIQGINRKLIKKKAHTIINF